MKRALSAMVMLLFLLPVPGSAGADPAVERWSTDRLLADNLTLPAGTDLSIGPGVNVTFSPRPDGAGPAVVVLDVGGGLEVCGTADRPVSFIGPDPSLAPEGGWAASLSVEGNGLPDQLTVRNCTFRDLTVDLYGTAGEFRDCIFEATTVYIGNSGVLLLNCTFHDSMVSIYDYEATNRSGLSGCRFEGSGDLSNSSLTAVKVSGYVDISSCDISGYEVGITSSSGLPITQNCTVHDCDVGFDLDTTDPEDTPVIANCTVRDCRWAGVKAGGNLLLQNSNLENSTDGLALGFSGSGTSPFSWSLGGDRIYNNSDFGILLYGQDLDLSDTLFDDGAGHTNGLGRVLKVDGITVQALLPSGSPVSSCNITVTDSTGNTTREDYVYGDTSLEPLKDYQIDDSGARVDFYPYNITVESLGRSNSTVLSGPAGTVTMVLALLPELAPSGLQLSPRSPRAGDYVSFRFQANNSGAVVSGLTTALFILDGKTLDEVQVFPLTTRYPVTVYSVEWKAVAGAHRIEVRLDPDNKVPENDETDNNLTLDFTVRPAPAAPASVPYAQLVGAGALVVAAIAAGFWAARLRRGRREGA